MNIDEMPAGRDIDVLVAYRIMGWTEISGALGSVFGIPPEEEESALYDIVIGFGKKMPIPKYSINIAAAWRVVEKLATEHYITSVGWGPGRDGRSYASVQMILDCNLAANLVLNNPREMDGRGLTAPLAICRAVLKVMEGKEHGQSTSRA